MLINLFHKEFSELSNLFGDKNCIRVTNFFGLQNVSELKNLFGQKNEG